MNSMRFVSRARDDWRINVETAEDTLVWFSVSAGPASMSAFLTQEQATELRDLLTSQLLTESSPQPNCCKQAHSISCAEGIGSTEP